MSRIYIAGPMRGIPLWNFPAFDAARDFLAGLGHDPVSPADMDRDLGLDEHADELPAWFTIEGTLRRDFAAITTCDAVAFLPGWERSTGALAERRCAQTLGIRCWRIDPESRTFAPEVIVGLAGYARAGKDTVASVFECHGYERRSFAAPLKAMLAALDPVVPLHAPMEDPEDVDVLHARLSHLVDAWGWDDAKKVPDVRNLLQRLGTEGGRNVLGNDVWVEALLGRPHPRKIVISDCRFPNEADAIRARGGLVVRVHRPGVTAVNAHPSETALDDYEFDAVITNDRGPEDLGPQVADLAAR